MSGIYSFVWRYSGAKCVIWGAVERLFLLTAGNCCVVQRGISVGVDAGVGVGLC